ncbi:MAG TPA: hypothetical protein PLI53_10495 [Geobacteraceae bacterium]|nr:hypothetical protein [Geobacteraceae bacterium]
MARTEALKSGSRLVNPAEPGFEIVPTGSGTYVLKLWGKLHPGCIGSLSSGLSRNKINIIRGQAVKSISHWDILLEIAKSGFATDPNKLDLLALAKEEDNDDVPQDSFSISRFTLEPPEKHNDALYLEVKAPDQLGFLGRILNRLAFLLLFPEKIMIDTVNNRIYDKFWIRGLGGNPPSATAQAALRKKLEECSAT